MPASNRIAIAFLLLISAAAASAQGPPRAEPGIPASAESCNQTYDGYSRRIDFSGYTWAVKDHGSQKAGPGPNFFSASSDNVWVDDAGRLHLKITKSKGKWAAAEVISLCSFGYGTYRFYLDSEVDKLDPNVVLGLFTWSDDPADNHIELDIEFSRWANPNNLNAQYVVQPYDTPGNIFQFWQPAAWAQTTQTLSWTPGSAAFESYTGHWASGQSEGPFASHEFIAGIPSPGNENARINLWLFRGRAPSDRKPVEAIISRFEFEPAP
jgi:hypothetical protein